MKRTFTRMAVSLAAAGLLTSGMALAVATPAMAETTPCGLSQHTESLPGGPLKITYYKIKNCTDKTVKRKIEIAGTTDGECHTIKPGQTASGERIIAGWAAVRGIKSC